MIALESGLFQLLFGEERTDVHRVAELHVGELAGHGDGCIPLIRIGSFGAWNTFLPATTVALKRNFGRAGCARAAAASVAGGRARVAAVRARQRARLLAAALRQAVPAVAEPFAAVHFTRQHLVTRQAAGNVLEVARDVAALLMLSHAPFLSEVCAGWTFVVTVAVVKHWMVTLVSSRAQVLALRRLRATGNRGV